MMTIDKDLKEGDLVYMWWSLVNEKKPIEREFKVVEKRKTYLKLRSTSGSYDLIFGDAEIGSFYGNVRKV